MPIAADRVSMLSRLPDLSYSRSPGMSSCPAPSATMMTAWWRRRLRSKRSGNLLNKNIGTFLKDEIKRQAKEAGIEINVKYFDPTYQIRAGAANGTDAVFCLMLAQNAVHAAMTGRTDVVIGHWSESFTHVPIPMAVKERKKIAPDGSLWQAVRLNTWHK